MLFYALLDRAFPNSFPIKVFTVAFVGTHVPLIAVVIYALIQTGGIAAHLDVLALLLAATPLPATTPLTCAFSAPLR